MGNKIDLKQIRVLAHSHWYPGWVYAARRGLDPAIVDKIKKALLALNIGTPEHMAILKKAGFITVIPARMRTLTRSGDWARSWNPGGSPEKMMKYTGDRPRGITGALEKVGIMRFLDRLSFRSKIFLGITSVILVFGVLSAVFVSRIATSVMLGEIQKRGLNLAVSLAVRTADPLLALDFLRLKNMVDEVKESSDDIVYAFVQDKSGGVLSHTFKGGFPINLKDANQVPSGSHDQVQLLDIVMGI